jgi:hypothetical protein
MINSLTLHSGNHTTQWGAITAAHSLTSVVFQSRREQR